MDTTDSIVIDLTKGREVNEMLYNAAVMGAQIKMMLYLMFGSSSPFNAMAGSVTGTKDQIKAFAGALAAEKTYMDAFNKNGLNDKNTYRSRISLHSAVSKFERQTGIPWPFK
jgi:hypothetical protein